MAKTKAPPANSKAKKIEALVHDDASRKNIPTAEFQSVMREEDQRPVRVAYQRRNPDLDPQLIWRGKYPGNDIDATNGEQDLFTVPAPPLYIQEKVHPKALIDDLRRQTEQARRSGTSVSDCDAPAAQIDLFADFNGLPNTDAKTEFYQHDQHWSNRMILGDSLQVMASLAEREGLRGKVQCIYFDPPYGIKFNSNFQWSTTSTQVQDGSANHITREPEQVKAFRDTWRDGVHSYLSYIRDRLIVARDLLAQSGSIFIQISDENVHILRSILEEVFGADNYCGQIAFTKATGLTSDLVPSVFDYLLWFAKDRSSTKFRRLVRERDLAVDRKGEFRSVDPLVADPQKPESGVYRTNSAISPGVRANTTGSFEFLGKTFESGSNRNWKTVIPGMIRLAKANRLQFDASPSRMYKQFWTDFAYIDITNIWSDVRSEQDRIYVVQTVERVVQRCILMTSDPGDLVLDPSCGSGTTAYVAEQWGRRWITIDTSRVALALARARIMGARYPFYLLADSPEGQLQEAVLSNRPPSDLVARGDIRQGFVYERVPHISLKTIADNLEIDLIWEEYEHKLEQLRGTLNSLVKKPWQEWEIPFEADPAWSTAARDAHNDWWSGRIVRQKKIDASIASRAVVENLYDKPYEDRGKVRVAGPFTVESLSPHRVLEMMDEKLAPSARDSYDDPRDAGNFVQVMLDTLKASGVQTKDKGVNFTFSSLTPWPGQLVCAEGRYEDADGKEKRAAILIGPEFGTVSRPDLVSAAREAGDANFDVLIACAFNFDAQSSEFSKLGRIPVLKARMNADLHMAEDLKNTGKGNLFVIFGEPDITILPCAHDEIRVKVNGVDVFHPGTGEVTSSEPDEIACWFVDTDYNEESFFVRQAYFLGANDPYKSLKTTLKAEINEDAWESLHSDTSRPFPKPTSGRIAVKVINHLGDEVMKVFTI